MRRISASLGYIKPVGQRLINYNGLQVDEDCLLFDSIYDLGIPLEATSPVAIDGRMTRNYLDNPEGMIGSLIDAICRAFDRAAFERDYIIIEGSGHAGVGSVFDLSNAAVAKLLGAKAIIVSEGGIGSPVDEIALNAALFEKFGVQVIGAILNKVLPDKVDAVRHYAGEGLRRHGIPLLGLLPLQKRLEAPNLAQIVERINGRWLNGEKNGRRERVLKVVIGAMTAKGVVEYLQPGVLIITPGDREDILFSAIAMAGISRRKVLSGIVLTRNILPHPKLMELIAQTDIPVVIAADESYSVASCIHSMTVKTQPEDEDKIPIIRQMFLDNIDLDSIQGAFTGAG